MPEIEKEPISRETRSGMEGPRSMDTGRKAILLTGEAANFKASDIVLLNVSSLSSFADYFIICSGTSSRQVQGIADNIEAGLKERGLRPLGVEGRREGHWVLMDYGDVIIHIFYEPVRAFYDLESLWSEAERVDWEKDTADPAGPGGGGSL